MDSETGDYNEFANETPFENNMLQLFQFQPVFTAAEIQAKRDVAGTSAWSMTGSTITELDALPAH